MQKISLIILLFVLVPVFQLKAQNYLNDDDVSALYASTKQVNQFIRRFNGEEDLHGKRLYPKDKKYRNVKLRKRYLKNLFDNQNYSISSNQKTELINDVTSSSNSSYFDFYGKNWFAEVNAKFSYQGKVENVVLYFRMEKETGG